MKSNRIIPLSEYVDEFYEGNQTKAAKALVTVSTGKCVDAAVISRNSKIDGFVVVIEANQHRLCRVLAIADKSKGNK